MKRIFITFIFALCTTIASAQVKVLGKIEPNGPTDTYPTHVDSLGKGGFVAVSTWQERNSIPLQRRKAGMMVSVKSATVDSLYRLGLGLTNAYWLPYVASMDVSGKANLAGGNTFTGTNIFDVVSPNKLNFSTLYLGNKEPNTIYSYMLTQGSGIGASQLNLALHDGISYKLKVQMQPNRFYHLGVMHLEARNALTDTIPTLKIGRGNNINPANGEIEIYKGITGLPSSITRLQFNPDDTKGGSYLLKVPQVNGTLATTSDIVDKANLSGGNTFQDTQFIENGNIQISNGHFETDGNLQGSAVITVDPNTGKSVVLQVDPSITTHAIVNLPTQDGKLALISDLADKEDKANKATSLASPSNTTYPTTQAITNKLYEYGKLNTINIWGLLDGSPWGWEPIPYPTNVFTNGIKIGLDTDYLTDGFIDFTESGGGNTVKLQSTAGTDGGVVYKLPAKTTGTYDLATTSDIPKMFTYTSIEHTDRNEIEYNLGFTPTMAMAVINSDVAQNIVISSVQISSSIITVQTSASLPAGTKFTIMVK